MRVLCGMVLWMLGGWLLGGGMTTTSLWLGWATLGGGAVMFAPRLWRMETATTLPTVRLMLRAPYYAFGAVFTILALVCIWAMGHAMTAGHTTEAMLLAFTSFTMFGAVEELVMPLAAHIRRLELDGRPQPVGFNVLEVARDLGGRLTPAELAADFDLDYREAKAALVRLMNDGACERIVTRNGAVVYQFLELETDKIDLLEA